jgi:hypothetical protein
MLQKMTPSLAEYVLPAHNSHVAVDMTYLLPALHAFGGTHCVLAGLTELGELHAWHTTCPLVFVYVSPVHCSHVSDDATYLEPALHESWVTAAAAAVSSRATPRRRMEGRPPLLEDETGTEIFVGGINASELSTQSVNTEGRGGDEVGAGCVVGGVSAC